MSIYFSYIYIVLGMFLCLSKVDQLVPTVGSRVTQEYNDRYVIEREGERLQYEL